MKNIYFIILAAVAFSFPTLAQDSTGVKEKTEKVQHETGNNGKGMQMGKKKNDVFIDKDGDGICDFRAKGMSFEKFRKRKQQGTGDGQGNGKGKN